MSRLGAGAGHSRLGALCHSRLKAAAPCATRIVKCQDGSDSGFYIYNSDAASFAGSFHLDAGSICYTLGGGGQPTGGRIQPWEVTKSYPDCHTCLGPYSWPVYKCTSSSTVTYSGFYVADGNQGPFQAVKFFFLTGQGADCFVLGGELIGTLPTGTEINSSMLVPNTNYPDCDTCLCPHLLNVDVLGLLGCFACTGSGSRNNPAAWVGADGSYSVGKGTFLGVPPATPVSGYSCDFANISNPPAGTCNYFMQLAPTGTSFGVLFYGASDCSGLPGGTNTGTLFLSIALVKRQIVCVAMVGQDSGGGRIPFFLWNGSVPLGSPIVNPITTCPADGSPFQSGGSFAYSGSITISDGDGD